jgi:hypothetical protein
LLGRNVSEQNEIVHVTLKLGLISCANVITWMLTYDLHLHLVVV